MVSVADDWRTQSQALETSVEQKSRGKKNKNSHGNMCNYIPRKLCSVAVKSVCIFVHSKVNNRLFFNAERQIVIQHRSPGLCRLRCDLPLSPYNPEWCRVMLVLSSRYHGARFTPCLQSSRVCASKSGGLSAQSLWVSAACQGCDTQPTFRSCQGHCIT